MQRILLLAGWLLLPAFLYSQTTTAKYFLKTLNCDQGTTMCFDAGGNLWVGARRTTGAYSWQKCPLMAPR